jgi:uncharacterized membrane protein YhaH (DUF805 family)
MIDDEAIRSIEKLHKMKQDGIISDADFEKAKENLLAGRPQTKARAVAPGRTMNDPPRMQVSSETQEHLAWILLPLRRYADFTGRSQRKEFWMFQLIYVALFFVGMVFIGGSTTVLGGWTPFGRLVVVLIVLALLGLFVPLLAVQVRRLHDQDKSGWIALLNLIPYLGPIVMLIFMLIDGTPGPNRFGDDPKGR